MDFNEVEDDNEPTQPPHRPATTQTHFPSSRAMQANLLEILLGMSDTFSVR